MPALSDIYSEEWFRHDFDGLQPEFDLVAKGIIREFDRYSIVIDVGCGPGMLLRGLDDFNMHVHGIDGSKHALSMAIGAMHEHISIEDITELDDLRTWLMDRCNDESAEPGLVVCTEVAEHLDEADAPNLVSLLCSGMCPIVFTAAPPGQDGHHHVNCRDPNYWISLFHEHGAIVDDACTDRLKLRWSKLKRLSHMTRNVMVFR